jgi:hypothetical protein
MNNVLLIVVDSEKKATLLDRVKELQASFAAAGLRAFVLPVAEEI